MARLALAGSYYNLSGLSILADARREEVEVPRSGGGRNRAGGRKRTRTVPLLDCGDFVFLPRHGIEHYVPPHAVDHGANMRALDRLGCDRVLSIGSVGSLDPELAVGSIVCPDDFIALNTSVTTFNDERAHRVIGFDEGWRRHLIARWREWTNTDLRTSGVYWQTVGPRLETAAEVRLIARHADVVGMTVASECVVADELHVRYAAICVVDNLANGIDRHLTMERVDANRASNREALDSALSAIVPPLAEEVREDAAVRDIAEHVPHFHRDRERSPEGTA
jgi:5'-methylthioadenosine phosphorylase